MDICIMMTLSSKNKRQKETYESNYGGVSFFGDLYNYKMKERYLYWLLQSLKAFFPTTMLGSGSSIHSRI